MSINSDDKTLIRSYIVILCVLAVGLGGFGLWSYYYVKDLEQEIRINTDEDIHRIRIEKSAAVDATDAIELAKNEDGWYLTQPIQTKASDSRINTLLGLVQRPAPTSYPSSEVDLPQLGLEPANITLWFNDGEYRLGDLDKMTDLRYLLYNDRVYLLESSEYSMLESDAYAWCESRLAQYPNEITSIKLGRFHLVRDEQTADWIWQIDEQATAYPEHLNLTLNQLSQENDELEKWSLKISRAYALHARAGKQIRTGITEPLPRLEIDLIDGKKIAYELISADEEVIFYDPETGVNHHFSTETQRKILQLPLAKGIDEPETDQDQEPNPDQAEEPNPDQAKP